MCVFVVTTTDQQGEYKAICLGKVGMQSVAISFNLDRDIIWSLLLRGNHQLGANEGRPIRKPPLISLKTQKKTMIPLENQGKTGTRTSLMEGLGDVFIILLLSLDWFL